MPASSGSSLLVGFLFFDLLTMEHPRAESLEDLFSFPTVQTPLVTTQLSLL